MYPCIGVGTVFRLLEQNGTTFWLGKQKLVKNSQDNQFQSITLCNMYFSKKVHTVYNGVWSKAPEAVEFSRIFVLKVTLQSVQDVLVAPPIILLEIATPIPAPMLSMACSANLCDDSEVPQFRPELSGAHGPARDEHVVI